MKSFILGFVFVALTVPNLGCGGGDNGRVTVSGAVTLDGKPLDGAFLAFIGGGGGALETATTDKDGNFKMLAAPGTNRVTVSKEDVSKAEQAAPKSDAETLMGTDAQYREQQKSKPKALVPASYSNPETSGLSFEVAKGMQPLKIDLLSK